MGGGSESMLRVPGRPLTGPSFSLREKARIAAGVASTMLYGEAHSKYRVAIG